MRFSIIIPLYNCEESISKVISSIEKQNFPQNDFEIICVDDKSSDNTISVVKKFRNIKLIKLAHNGGNGRAKNIGVKIAKGEIIFFVDDHIYLDNNAFSILDKLFKKYPEISGVCGYYESLKEQDGNIFRDIRRRTIYGKSENEKVISSSSFSPFSIIIGALKKELFDKEKFPEHFGKNSCEDIVFQVIQLNRSKSFLYSPKVRGLHDHRLGNIEIVKKMIIEIKGTGDLIYYLLSNNQKIPFQYGFLSFPLLLITSIFLVMINKNFLSIFLTSFILEALLATVCFTDKKTPFYLRLKAWTYIFGEEILKGVYLPIYLIQKRNVKLEILIKSIWQLFEWEKIKLKNLVTNSFLLEYAKI